MNGPSQGLRVIEFAGLGPAPFAGMMLADMGAQVLRIARPGFDPQHASPVQPPLALDVLARGRRVLPLDLREPPVIGAVLAIPPGSLRGVSHLRAVALRPWLQNSTGSHRRRGNLFPMKFTICSIELGSRLPRPMTVQSCIG